MRRHFTFLFNGYTLVALIVALLGSTMQVTPVYAASIVVNSDGDTIANDGLCTLREALIAAQQDAHTGGCAGGSGADTITFTGNFTITVGSQLPAVATAITITGEGMANTVIQAAAISNIATWRVFQVTSDGNLTLDGVTIRHGRCLPGSCTILGGIPSDAGGGIYNSGTLTISNSLISGNRGSLGGGIYNGGILTVTGSIISNNNAFLVTTDQDGGGGIRNNGTLTVTDSTISGNRALSGGGIMNDFGTLTVTNTTVSGNSALMEDGGGILHRAGTATVTNSTITANSARRASGGIFNGGDTMLVTDSTIAGNNARDTGGVDGFGTTILRNSIVANNNGGNCGTITDGGGNLSWPDTSCPGINADPLLGPLANNGGHTHTMALQSGSPAIDAADDMNCPDTDQRGGPRPQGSHCDIGAYEFDAPVTYLSSFSDVPPDYWALSFIERLYRAGITGGCITSPLSYCPETNVTRAQIAIFLLRGIHGASHTPPALVGSTGFGDVPVDYWAAAWIKQLADEGVTAGCGSGNYCPEAPVTRAQMAVYLLRAKHGGGFVPPAVGGSTGFGDVPPGYWAAAWIKELVAEGIAAGCGGGNYCPESPVTRAQMAVFLVKTFGLP